MATTIDNRLEPALALLNSKVSSALPLMRTLAGILNFAVEENFRTEGKRLPGGWPQLSKKTIAQRKRLKLWPGKILDRHGASGLAGANTQKWTDTTSQVSNNKIQAPLMNYGGQIKVAARTEIFERLRFKKGTRKGKFKKLSDDRAVKKGMAFQSYIINIPPRPFMKLNDDDIKKINSAIYSYLSRL
jgi:phage gpG-like protein